MTQQEFNFMATINNLLLNNYDFDSPDSEYDEAIELFETLPAHDYNKALALLEFVLEQETSLLSLSIIEEMLSDNTLTFLDGITSSYDYGKYLFDETYYSEQITKIRKYIDFEAFGEDNEPDDALYTEYGMVYRD